MNAIRINCLSLLTRLHEVRDILPCLNNYQSYGHLIIEAPTDDPHAFDHDFSEYRMYEIMDLVEALKIQQLTLIGINFEGYDYRSNDLDFLKVVVFEDCLYTKRLIRQIMVHAHDIKSISDVSSKQPNPSSSVYEWIDKHIELCVKYLQRNRQMMAFNCCEFDLALQSPTAAKFPKLVENMRLITAYIKQNVTGYNNCRAAIYQLFLIKYYSKDNVFRCLSKDIVMVIAKLLRETMFTEVWDR